MTKGHRASPNSFAILNKEARFMKVLFWDIFVSLGSFLPFSYFFLFFAQHFALSFKPDSADGMEQTGMARARHLGLRVVSTIGSRNRRSGAILRVNFSSEYLPKDGLIYVSLCLR